jgi:hypothetical protein
MFEIIGLIIGTAVFFGLAIMLGLCFAFGAWLLFWGRHRPKLLVVLAAVVPTLSAAYILLCAIGLTIFVPNQPDLFFGDISEPLPNGYLLKGLGKMPEYSYIDVTSPKNQQPSMRGGIRRLELRGQVVYGAYGHLDNDQNPFTNQDNGYFIFDTRTGQVKNIDTLNQLTTEAGHPLQLVETQFFRSQDPGAILLRRVENAIFFGPPILAIIFVTLLLIRKRCKPQETDKQTMQWQPPAWETPTN